MYKKEIKIYNRFFLVVPCFKNLKEQIQLLYATACCPWLSILNPVKKEILSQHINYMW